jgi:hypothetical protein
LKRTGDELFALVRPGHAPSRQDAGMAVSRALMAGRNAMGTGAPQQRGRVSTPCHPGPKAPSRPCRDVYRQKLRPLRGLGRSCPPAPGSGVCGLSMRLDKPCRRIPSPWPSAPNARKMSRAGDLQRSSQRPLRSWRHGR